jgi:hypothetical protein
LSPEIERFDITVVALFVWLGVSMADDGVTPNSCMYDGCCDA